MFRRYCLGALGLIFVVLPFTGCTSTGIDAITVSPTLTSFEGVGGSVQLTAIATIGHGSQHPATYEDVTKLVKWSTPLGLVAQVNTNGYVTLVGYGITQINATVNGYTGVVSGSATVCAEQPPPATNGITCPSSAAFRPKTTLSLIRGERSVSMPGEEVQFRVIGTTRETGAEDDLTDGVKWSSTDESVATVSRSGRVTGVGKGTATIMATLTNEDKTAVAAAAKFTVGTER